MGGKTKIKSMDAYLYRQVWQITQWKNGCIYKTVHKGYCKSSRPIQENEVYSCLSTKWLAQEEFELELLE